MLSLISMVILLILYMIFTDNQTSIKFAIEYVEKSIILFSGYAFSDKFTKEENDEKH